MLPLKDKEIYGFNDNLMERKKFKTPFEKLFIDEKPQYVYNKIDNFDNRINNNVRICIFDSAIDWPIKKKSISAVKMSRMKNGTIKVTRRSISKTKKIVSVTFKKLVKFKRGTKKISNNLFDWIKHQSFFGTTKNYRINRRKLHFTETINIFPSELLPTEEKKKNLYLGKSYSKLQNKKDTANFDLTSIQSLYAKTSDDYLNDNYSLIPSPLLNSVLNDLNLDNPIRVEQEFRDFVMLNLTKNRKKYSDPVNSKLNFNASKHSDILKSDGLYEPNFNDISNEDKFKLDYQITQLIETIKNEKKKLQTPHCKTEISYLSKELEYNDHYLDKFAHFFSSNDVLEELNKTEHDENYIQEIISNCDVIFGKLSDDPSIDYSMMLNKFDDKKNLDIYSNNQKINELYENAFESLSKNLIDAAKLMKKINNLNSDEETRPNTFEFVDLNKDTDCVGMVNCY